MKKVLLGAVVLGVAFTGSASAGQSDDTAARLTAIEKENAAIRKENAALIENKRLHDQNGVLKTSSAQPLAPAVAVPAAPVAAAAAAEETGTWASMKKKFSSVFSSEQKPNEKSVFDSYAADLPVKAIAPPRPGVITFWAQGGAIWTGGDPVFADFNLINPTNIFGLFGANNSAVPAHFQLDPKIGWEAAVGFDYRFANSPWHASMQFRYGEGGRTNGSAATSGQLPASILALINGPNANNPITAIGGSEQVNVSYRETHWLADAAVGY